MTLIEAILAGDAEKVAERLEAGDDVNMLGDGDTTPLIEAARLGSVELVEVLLSAGAEPFMKDREQETALLKAAANGHRSVCALLLESATEDERGMATAFIAAYGKTDGPKEIPPPPGFMGFRKKIADFKKNAAVIGARAAKFVGYEQPAERIQTIERAEERKGIKTDRPKLVPPSELPDE